MSKSPGAVLLLTACIEWLTQRHYQECFEGSVDLDPFTKHIFKCHWLEESQHAKMDHLETVRFQTLFAVPVSAPSAATMAEV